MSRLFDRLKDHVGPPDDAELARGLWDEFGCERTVLVLDMAGFARTSREHGVVYYLTLIERMRRVTARHFPESGGRPVKWEADNFYAVFLSPVLAMDYLQRVFAEMDLENAGCEPAAQIHLCAGLDHGKILLDSMDFFGEPVNMASRLGEDLARKGEVLVTSVVKERLRLEAFLLEEVAEHDGETTIYRWARSL